MTRPSTIALLATLVACDPYTSVTATVRVSPGVQALYDASTPALVHLEVEAGSLLEIATLATLCEPTDAELVLEETLGGIACAGPGTITAWVEPVGKGVIDCGTLEDTASSAQVERSTDHVQDSEEVFQALEDSRCVSGADAVQLFLGL